MFLENPAISPKVADWAESLPRPLPVELHRDIVQNIDDKETLLALCKTNHAFKVEAERILYRSMKQTSYETDNLLKRHMGFLQTIVTVRHLGALVHTYHLQLDVDFGDIEDKRELVDLLQRALQAMVNLRGLRLEMLMDGIESDSKFFEHCDFQLESLHLGSTQTAQLSAAFLSSQKNLRHLAVNFAHDSQDLPASVCPNLKVLQGNRNTINALLPHHEIRTLIYSPDAYEMNEPLIHLSEPLGHLQVLSLGGFYLRPSLRILADFLCSLEYLELVSLHAGEIEVVCQLPSLRGLVLTEAFSLTAWEQRPSIVSSIFSRCPNLWSIDIQQVYYQGTDGAHVYQRWTLPPGSKVPVFQESIPQDVVRQKFVA